MPASSVAVWILGAAFLAGGFAAGYVVGQGGDALPDDEPPPLERSVAPSAPSAPVRTLEAPEPTPEQEAHLESARAARLAPLREILDDMPTPVVPRGNGVVSGHVKTEEGEGVAGVEITLYPQQERKGKGPDGWDEPEDMTVAVMEAIESVRWRRLSRMRTTTGSDGAYRFDTVGDGTHHLQAQADGWQVHAADPRRGYQVRAGATIDFVARRVIRVPVAIVLPDGSAPDTAMVMMRQGNTHSGMGWSAGHPHLDLQPGTWELTVSAGEAQQFKADPQTVTVETGAAPPSLRFELASHGAIHGTVQYAPGERFQQGRVYLARIPKGQKADPSRLGSSEKTAHLHTWGGQRPSFSFPDLPPGRYLLGLSRSWSGGIVATKEVEVGEEGVEVVLEVPPLEREDYVVLSLLGPEGKPVAGAQIRVGRQSKSGGISSGGATVIEREDGTKWVLHQEGDASSTDAETTWWIEATHPEYGTVREEYRRARATSVEIRYGRPATIEVTVTGVAGTRYEGRVRVGLASSRPTRFGGGGGELDAEGRTELTGLQVGTYTVTLSLGDNRWRSTIHSEEVEVAAGKNRVRIALPTLYEVEVLGLEGRTWLRSSGKGRGHFSRNLSAAEDGRATVDGLPAGEYEIRSGRKRATFSVPGATTVRLE